jgi:acyl-CoA oxidase
MNRIELLKNQLASGKQGIVYKTNKNPLNKWKKKSTIDKDLLDSIYFPHHRELRDAVYKIIINNPEFKHYYQHDMTIDEIRLLTVKQIKVLVRELGKFSSFKEVREDPMKFYAFMEVVTGYDQGLGVKFGVHSVLYYNCLKNLSTEHHKIYMEKCVTFEDIGCFGLTEFGHGSNVRDIRTIATYDEVHKEFVLHSPSYDAYKWWIGGAGKTANMSCIFAQLYVKGVCHGVHIFLVPIRNKKTNLAYSGVILGDCGPKVGNENIDNGFIGFINYRVPRGALLNRYSEVSEDGIFSSSITSPDVRFATCLGALEEGRITIASGSQLLLKKSLVVAGRYAALRKQFGREDNEEYSILNYPTTQVRILPALAEHFAFRFAGMDLVNRWLECVV